MLGFIRRNADSPLIKIILGVLALTFVFFFGSSTLFGDRTEVVAEVNGQPIRDIELTEAVRRQVAFQRQFNPKMTDEDVARIQQQVLDDLIDRKLQLESARAQGFVVADKEVRRAILDNPSFQNADGKFDAELYRKYVGGRGSGYERDLRDALLIESVQEFIRRSARVTEPEVKTAFEEEASSRELSFIRVPSALFFDAVSVSDEEAQTWAAANERAVTDRFDRDFETKYNQPKQVKANHILMKYGEDDGDDEKAVVRARMEAVLVEAGAAGADFGALARKYSEDGSAPRGGDLGFFDETRMVKPFTEAAFAMAPGAISGLVESEFGLHMIQVVEVKEALKQTLDDVRLEIARDLLRDERAPALALAHSKALVPVLSGMVTGEEADLALAEKSLTIQETGEFTRKDRRVPKLGSGGDAFKAAFALANEGEVTPEPVDLGNGYAILRLDGKVEADPANFTEQGDEIRQRLLRTKQTRAVNAWREELKAAARIRVAAGV